MPLQTNLLASITIGRRLRMLGLLRSTRHVPGLDFRLDATRSSSHELSASLEFDCSECSPPRRNGEGRDDAEIREIVLFLPTWTPGSYLIREYARHLSRVSATDAESGEAVSCQKVSKNRFRIRAGGSRNVCRQAPHCSNPLN